MNKNNGITLIALVISIIVTIIIIGIGFSAIIGENGIVNKAQFASLEAEDAEIWEKIQLVFVGRILDDIDKEEYIDYFNNQFEAQSIPAHIGKKNSIYYIIYGVNNRKLKILNDDLNFIEEIPICEAKKDIWEYQMNEDGTLKLINYKKEKKGDIVIPNVIDGYLVTEVGDNIFRNSREITNIKIADGIKKIGDSVFLNCNSVSNELKLPSTVEEVGSYAFYGCENITGNINNIVSKNIKFGKNVFGRCAKLEGDISILIDNLDDDLTVITEGMFSGFSGVTGNLVIPARITAIEDNAFYNCSKIESIEFEEGSQLTSIGNYAFYKCTSASNIINIPNGVTSIGDYAFYQNSSITGLNLSSNLENIGTYCFYNCNKLTGNLTIPSKINVIKNYTFCNTALKNITFENGNESDSLIIYESAFNNIKQLKEVTFSNKKITLQNEVFYGCSNLETINNFKYVVQTGHYSFGGCSKLTSLDFTNMNTIGTYSFSYCGNLSEINNLDNLKTIGMNAFTNCTKLNTIGEYGTDIIQFFRNSNVVTVSENAFLNCTKLTGKITDEIKNKNNYTINIAGSAFSGTQITKAVELNLAGKTEIADGEFKGVTDFVDSNGDSITEIEIPSTVTKIGKEAFSGCVNIVSVSMTDNVTSIGNYAFYGCSKLNEVILSKNITSIPSYCFSYCSALNNIEFPNNIKIINSNAFSRSGIKQANLVNVEKIYGSAFYTCKSMESVTLGNNLTYIGGAAFAENTKMVGELVIPDSVIQMDDAAWYRTYYTKITVGSGMNYLPTRCFQFCSNLETVIFKNANINVLKYNAFHSCSKLSSININWNSLTNIGDNAFNGCTRLIGTANLNINCVYNIENSFLNCPIIITQE